MGYTIRDYRLVIRLGDGFISFFSLHTFPTKDESSNLGGISMYASSKSPRRNAFFYVKLM